MSCWLPERECNQHATAFANTRITATSPYCHAFCNAEEQKGMPARMKSAKRARTAYRSCFLLKSGKTESTRHAAAKKTEIPLASQAIDASLMAKENTEMLSYPLRGCKSNQPRRGIGKDRTVCLFCARVVRFRSSFVQLSLLPCAKSLPVPGKPLSPRGMI